jgi:hypothetical protein
MTRLSAQTAMCLAKQLIGHHPDAEWQIAAALDSLFSVERNRERVALKQNKEHGKKIGVFEAALKRLRAAINNLPDPLRDRALKDKALDHSCQDWLAVCKDLRNGRGINKPRRDDALLKRVAAEQAFRLLTYYKADDVDASRAGRYCRLAAVLYLDPKADLTRYCREKIKVAKPGAK